MTRAKKRGPGRPPLPVTQRKAGRVELRLVESERAQWTAAAEREGLTLSEWVRAACELAWTRGSTR